MAKKLILLLLVPTLFLLTSCWDRRDIEDNAFVLGIGIDKAKTDDNIRVTFQIALPPAFGGENGGQQEGTWSIDIVAKDIYGATAKLLGDIDRVPNFQHLQVLLFGEEFARDGIDEVLDFFFRAPKVRYRTSVAVVEGEAYKALEVKPKTAKASAVYISQIINENSGQSLAIAEFYTIGGLFQNYVRKSPITLTKVVPMKDKVSIGGAGAFKDSKLVGWYDLEEIKGIRWIRGDVKSGEIGVDVSPELGERVVLDIFNTDSSLKPELSGNRLIAKNKIMIEGDIIEIQKSFRENESSKLIQQWEKAFEKEIKDIVEHAFLKSRDELGMDSFDFDRKVSNYYQNYWDQNKNDWDSIFRNIELDLTVEVKIRRVGEVKY